MEKIEFGVIKLLSEAKICKDGNGQTISNT